MGHETVWNAISRVFIVAVVAVPAATQFRRKAQVYHCLAKEFNQLERDMLAVPETEENLLKFTIRRWKIKLDEPPQLRVLNASCHNELVIAEDYPLESLAEIKWWQMWTRHFFDIYPDSIKTRKQLSQQPDTQC